jgi:hypothetical protein
MEFSGLRMMVSRGFTVTDAMSCQFLNPLIDKKSMYSREDETLPRNTEGSQLEHQETEINKNSCYSSVSPCC